MVKGLSGRAQSRPKYNINCLLDSARSDNEN